MNAQLHTGFEANLGLTAAVRSEVTPQSCGEGVAEGGDVTEQSRSRR